MISRLLSKERSYVSRDGGSIGGKRFRTERLGIVVLSTTLNNIGNSTPTARATLVTLLNRTFSFLLAS